MLEQVGRVAVERTAADWQIRGRARSVQYLLVRVANCGHHRRRSISRPATLVDE